MTEHLPVQRYYLNVRLHTSDVMQPAATNPNLTERSGDWVLYAEHVYALRACEERVQKIAYAQGLGAGSDEHLQHEAGWIKGYAAALNAAREAVKHLQHSDDCYYAEGVLCHCEIKCALAAIDALKEK